MDGEDIQAIEEIAAEFFLRDELGEIGVGGGDDADIDANGAIAAETFEFLFLKHAKQFGLEFQRKIADFVEKECAAVCKFEAADFLRQRSRKGATLVAEELGFEQACGNGGAVDFDERSFAAGTEIVNGARDDFFAGAGFAQDQNSGARGRGKFDLGERPAQDGAFANDFVKAEFSADFFLEIKFFDGELVFQRVNFLERKSIFDGDRDLRSDLAKQFDVGRGKILQIAAGEIDGAEGCCHGWSSGTQQRTCTPCSRR